MNVTSIQKMESKKIVGPYLDLDICTKKAVVRWNKANVPSDNVDLFRAILRNSKECSRCKHYKGNEFVGRCVKLNTNAESNDWCAGAFFVKK